MIYSLAHRFQNNPEKLDKWINEFVSDRRLSKGFQCGAISPILFCVNDSYPLINNRIRHTYNEFSKTMHWGDKMSQKLEDYIDNIRKCEKMIQTLRDRALGSCNF